VNGRLSSLRYRPENTATADFRARCRHSNDQAIRRLSTGTRHSSELRAIAMHQEFTELPGEIAVADPGLQGALPNIFGIAHESLVTTPFLAANNCSYIERYSAVVFLRISKPTKTSDKTIAAAEITLRYWPNPRASDSLNSQSRIGILN
jgi:hypothetical protein